LGGIIICVGPGEVVVVAAGVRVSCGVGVGIVVITVVTGVVAASPPEGPDMMFATITSPAKMGRMAMIRIPIAR
jgi:hypothetical protein